MLTGMFPVTFLVAGRDGSRKVESWSCIDQCRNKLNVPTASDCESRHLRKVRDKGGLSDSFECGRNADPSVLARDWVDPTSDRKERGQIWGIPGYGITGEGWVLRFD